MNFLPFTMKPSVIWLSYNKIEHIAEKTFHGLITLQRLVLSHNQLETLPTLVFASLFNLKYLGISHNKLKVTNMMRLDSIFLESNNISRIGESFLKNQYLIVRINPKHNERVDEDFFASNAMNQSTIFLMCLSPAVKECSHNPSFN